MGDIKAKFKEIFAHLPKTAGVYLFLAPRSSKSGVGYEPIYIGKAINIKERVKNHFFQPTYKDDLFLDSITKIDFIDTRSEIEALVLESQLIKKHQPKFNSVWRDDKNYFYVALEGKKCPIVYITHQKKQPDTVYIGPFVEGQALKKTLKFLRRIFPYYTTTKHPDKPCTWCYLGLCPGANPDLAEYKNTIKKLSLILQGKRKTVLYALRKEMDAFAKQNNFEEAGKVRDQINALEAVMEHTHVIEGQKVTSQGWDITQKLLQGILKIRGTVSKVECYDISNTQGTQAVGSMVVFVDGAPDKSQYKKFRIRMENTPNDIAMLKEVLTRRLTHPEWGWPEVMLIDGGIAQLNIGIRTKNDSEARDKIKIISIAKGRQELFIEPASSADRGQKPTVIPMKELPQEVYNLIKHLDDEAHRFAITYHKKLRKKHLLS